MTKYWRQQNYLINLWPYSLSYPRQNLCWANICFNFQRTLIRLSWRSWRTRWRRPRRKPNRRSRVSSKPRPSKTQLVLCSCRNVETVGASKTSQWRGIYERWVLPFSSFSSYLFKCSIGRLLGFELWIFAVGSKRSTNRATTTAPRAL